ncbi:hypothetical protein OKA04_03460 [Luteolibacter flavescens]|uniref:Uncharacterized protein n=1 Tax=Luteolibacter flavescens TaxID=1859460 RepID=A0ABT3FJP7_9BACT|nr:hypothetical protein [Luteolibacter flavescens]MCW1883771.1 hypothetical protein [Luteolibacter flavescens]
MTRDPRFRPGLLIGVAVIVTLAMAANIAAHGWNCFGFRPGGTTSSMLFLLLQTSCLPALPLIFVGISRVDNRPLKHCLVYLGVVITLGHIFLTIFGIGMFTSARVDPIWYYSAFLSGIVVTISPELIAMAFVPRRGGNP